MPSPFKLVIIGGVAAGLKAACKTARLRPDADITVLEKNKLVSYSGCGLPYAVSDVVPRIDDLVNTPIGVPRDAAYFEKVKGVEVRPLTEALSIDRTNKTVTFRRHSAPATGELPYDKLLIATGAEPVVPPLPGCRARGVFQVKRIEDARAIRAALDRSEVRKAVIIGGGLIGVEMAESLADRALDVTLVEALPHLLPMLDREIALLVEKHLDDQGITVLTETAVTAIEEENGRARAVVCGEHHLPAEIVILAVGVRPRVELARAAGLEIGALGGIRVGETMRTSDPDIFAAGDCVETAHILTGKPCYIPLGSTANKQGRVAAMNICGLDDAFPGVIGSTIVKVCDLNVACTGLSEEQARVEKIDTVSCLCPGPDRTHYYPGAQRILLKLVAERRTGRLLGVQAVGPGDVAKRVDAAVPAITAGMTADQVSKLDLCYAPPFASALDNLITAANVLRDKLEGRFTGVSSTDVHERLAGQEDLLLLDVRSPGEVKAAAIPGAVNVPLEKLREAAAKLPHDKPIVTSCQLGARGYEALLILRAAGHPEVELMEGGLAAWPYEVERS